MDIFLRRIYFSVVLALFTLWIGMIGWFLRELKYNPPTFELVQIKEKSDTAPFSIIPPTPFGIHFSAYRTSPDDTFLNLAEKFHISEGSLRSLNRLNDENIDIKSNSILYIPSKDGIFHWLLPGQGLSDISKAYGLSLKEILKENNKKGDFDVHPGEILYLPGGEFLSKHDTRWIVLKKLWIEKAFQKPTTGRFADAFGERIHPLTGKKEFHLGLDLAPGLGARVMASQDGIVTFASFKAGYGRLVILDHGKGLTSWYAHLDEILVKPRQFVKKGDLIGKVGKTGLATGPHLHFEVRLNGIPQNPLLYLVE